MNLNCKNCHVHCKGNFCYNCGQSTYTNRLNLNAIWHDIQHGFFHFDRGIFYTTKQLFTRPGYSIAEYISGKRIQHFKPISLVIVLAGIYTFLAHTLHIKKEVILKPNIGDDGKQILSPNYINLWMDNHYALTTLIFVFFLAVATKWAFHKKTGINYMESLVLHCFLTGQRLIIKISLLPIMYYTKTSKY